MRTGIKQVKGTLKADTWNLIYDSGEMVAAIVDSSSNAITATMSGTAQTSAAKKKIGNRALYLDGNSDYVTFGDNAVFDFSTGDFVIEGYINWTADPTGSQFVWSHGNGAPDEFRLYYNGATDHWLCDGMGVVFETSGTWNPTPDTWYHIALVRSSGTIYLLIDGVAQANTQSGGGSDITLAGNPVIGRSVRHSDFYLNAHVDEFRISKGTDRNYESGFTPSTISFTSDAQTSLLLHMEEQTVGSAFTIAGLNGDVDEEYMWIIRNVGTGSTTLLMQFNGDTGANYGYQELYSYASTASAYLQNPSSSHGFYVTSTNLNGDLSFGTGVVYAKSGFTRLALHNDTSWVAGSTVSITELFASIWANTADNITSITFSASGQALGVGSSIELYAKRSST